MSNKKNINFLSCKSADREAKKMCNNLFANSHVKNSFFISFSDSKACVCASLYKYFLHEKNKIK